MNIFYLSSDVEECVRWYVDKHVVKMPLETAQLLSTAHNTLDPDHNLPTYKSFNPKHPSCIWTMQSNNNYNWLYSLFIALGKEYTYRYGKVHKSVDKLRDVLSCPPRNIPIGPKTTMLMAMPDEYRISDDPILCYREYYRHGKSSLHSWKNRTKPEWL